MAQNKDSSLKDFVLSVLSDALMPVFRVALADVVYEALNEREVPNRSDYQELRDLVNKMRGTVSSVGPALQKFEKRCAELEAVVAAQKAVIERLEARGGGAS